MTRAVTQPLPPALLAWRALTALAAPLVPHLLTGRAKWGKEDRSRLPERLGAAPVARPAGLLVWLHGASVGESLVALSLASALRERRPDLRFLLTSGTRTSADLVGARLHPDDIHRFVPVDTPKATRAFMTDWKPDLGVFIEGEIWPNLILAAEGQGTRLALVNARMTSKSARGWARFPRSARRLFDTFAAALPADRFTKSVLEGLRSRPVGEPGNLKLASGSLVPPAAMVTSARAAIGNRPVWLAASTHAGEEALALAAHARLRMAAPDALLILAPRHPDRVVDVEVECRKAGFVPPRRSRSDPLATDTAVWLWDTLGELSVACAVAPVCFVAGSTLPSVAGHSPVDQALAGSAIVTGPEVANFADVYEALCEAEGAVQLGSLTPDSLAMTVAGLLGDPARRARMAEAARGVLADGGAAGRRTTDTLLGLLPAREAAS